MGYKFKMTPVAVRQLQTIERVRATVQLAVLPPVVAEQLRTQAHIRSTHYSTRIEGNRLTLKETEQVIQQGRLFPGRERDVREVEGYYRALQQVERWVAGGQPITEERIRKLHANLYSGKRARPTPYRDGQNVIRESGGELVYLPPEAGDVPGLMGELVAWVNQSRRDLPIPVVAGIAHYQFETIHPFFDGNGRTGRLLTTWILHQGGYDLGKLYALEEFYVEDLPGYYRALVTHKHHNYYFGRDQADVTPWLEYFLHGMAIIFERVAAEVARHTQQEGDADGLELLRPLDPRARRVLGLFAEREYIRAGDVANLLGLSPRQARQLCSDWMAQGWLMVADPSRKGRKYQLAAAYKGLIFRE